MGKAGILTLFAVMFLAGCVSKPTPEEIANADYGSYPEEYQKPIESFMSRALKDPSSAKYEFLGRPQKTWATVAGDTEFGYGLCAYINAKNSFGGYTGAKLYFFLIKNGSVSYYQGGMRRGTFGEAMVENICESLI